MKMTKRVIYAVVALVSAALGVLFFIYAAGYISMIMEWCHHPKNAAVLVRSFLGLFGCGLLGLLFSFYAVLLARSAIAWSRMKCVGPK
jgi:uncharacterized membrane protein